MDRVYFVDSRIVSLGARGGEQMAGLFSPLMVTAPVRLADEMELPAVSRTGLLHSVTPDEASQGAGGRSEVEPACMQAGCNRKSRSRAIAYDVRGVNQGDGGWGVGRNRDQLNTSRPTCADIILDRMSEPSRKAAKAEVRQGMRILVQEMNQKCCTRPSEVTEMDGWDGQSAE